jgi:sugar/nucleoside kinase (ribokinase family)
VTVDVVCAVPVFLDLTFEGVGEFPELGRERFAEQLHETPGGGGIIAVGLARLGLRVAVAAGLGNDLAGQTVRRLLAREGVTCAETDAERTPVTVVVPLDGERAFITYEPPADVERAAVASFRPRAAVVGLNQLDLVPPGVLGFVVVGDREAERYAGALPLGLGAARALLANRNEAERLTGQTTPETAARLLAEHVPTAVVTCGRDGAAAAANGELVRVEAPPVAVRDTTGAGDLLVAAFVWGELGGLPLEERLRRAVVYATLSVRTATAAAGAATLDELERALVELDPAIVQTASAKESA